MRVLHHAARFLMFAGAVLIGLTGVTPLAPVAVAAPAKTYALVTEVIPDRDAAKPGEEFKITVTLDRRTQTDAYFQVTLRPILADNTLGAPQFTKTRFVPANRDEATFTEAAKNTTTPFSDLQKGLYLITVSQLGDTVQQFAALEVSDDAEVLTAGLVDVEVASMPSYTPISRIVPLPADGLVTNAVSRFISRRGETDETPELNIKPGAPYKIEVRTRRVNEQDDKKTEVFFQLIDEKTEELVDSWMEKGGLTRGGRITDFTRYATLSGKQGANETPLPEGRYRLLARRKASKRKATTVEALINVEP